MKANELHDFEAVVKVLAGALHGVLPTLSGLDCAGRILQIQDMAHLACELLTIVECHHHPHYSSSRYHIGRWYQWKCGGLVDQVVSGEGIEGGGGGRLDERGVN